MVLDVVRPEMAMDFGSKEVELMLDEGIDVGLLKTVSICLLDRKCPCKFA